MSEARRLYDKNAGFKPWGGDRVANMSPYTTAAHTGILNTAGGDNMGQIAAGVNNQIMQGAFDLDPTQLQQLYGQAGSQMNDQVARFQDLYGQVGGQMQDQVARYGQLSDQVGGQMADQVGRYTGLFDEAGDTQNALRAKYEQMFGSTGNPYFESVINKQAGDLTNDIGNMYSMGGRYGGAAMTGTIADQVGDFRNKMASDNWYQNIASQLGILNSMGGMEQGMYGVRGGFADDIAGAQRWGTGAQAGLADAMAGAERWGSGAQAGLANNIMGAQLSGTGMQAGLANNINALDQQNLVNRMGAMGMMPTIQDAMYDPWGRMASVGADQQMQEQREIDARKARFDERQMSPWQRLQAYMGTGMPAAGQGGTTTTTQEANPWAMLLGGGLSLASMMAG